MFTLFSLYNHARFFLLKYAPRESATMPRYLKNLFVVGVTLFSISQVFAKKRELPEQVIVTPVGNFRLTNLKIDHALGFQFIDGELLNETNKT